ncbi:MAG TPA: methyltransferase domain-containing protein [Bryobacteraceae bacterium]|jgi:ubiquinone/menaquinone biosynthesis C-methylase UbiE|nr:methyltransferase domain-containing protein [Bryobacteraceae bacterium]
MDLRKQFAKPEGTLGWFVGHVMAMKNQERSEFVFSILELRPEDRVLEIGFGPGADLQRASRAAAFVAGIDHSDVMVKQASRRNASAIRDGRVQVQLGSANKLPFPEAHFDKIFAINSAQFWKDSVGTLTEVGRVLKPGGAIALAIQPRNKGATEDHAYQAGRGLADAMKKAGFSDIHSEARQMKPVSTVCVLGKK